MSKIAEMEALLFVAGEDGLTVRQIADLLSLPPTGVIQSLEKLARSTSRIRILAWPYWRQRQPIN